jgi:hypothetical protein
MMALNKNQKIKRWEKKPQPLWAKAYPQQSRVFV